MRRISAITLVTIMLLSVPWIHNPHRAPRRNRNQRRHLWLQSGVAITRIRFPGFLNASTTRGKVGPRTGLKEIALAARWEALASSMQGSPVRSSLRSAVARWRLTTRLIS